MEMNEMTENKKVEVDGITFDVELEAEEQGWKATVEGKTFMIKFPDGGGSVKKKRSSGRSKKSGTVSANIPGKIVTVEVSVGDQINEGDVILILEAMKMQNEIQAPISGTITSIQCEEGQSIEANVPLVIIQPDEDGGNQDE